MTGGIGAMRSPCRGCELEKEDKNNSTCLNCTRRIDYINAIGPENAPITRGRIISKEKETEMTTKKSRKINLSEFTKVETTQQINTAPILTVARDNAFCFNRAAIKEFKIGKTTGVSVYVKKSGKTQVVFAIDSKNPTFFIRKSSSWGFSSKKLLAETGLKYGKYPIQNIDGMMLVEVSE